MKKHSYLTSALAALSVFFVFSLAIAQPAQHLPEPINRALARAGIPAEAVGVFVAPVDGAEPTLTVNADAAFNPASTMKLVTTYAGLELLGAAYRWETQVFAAGDIVDGVLYGDLIIKGSGSPKWVMEDFWMFLRRLRAAGVQDIRGNVVLDRSVFADAPFDAAAFDNQPIRSYNVGPDALLLNFKTLALRFTPEPHNGQVRVQMEPPLAAFPIQVPKLVQGRCEDWRGALGMRIDAQGASFSGTYAAACGEQVWHVHPYQLTNDQYFDLTFRRFWAGLGGVLRGSVIAGPAPANASKLYGWGSASLAEMIRDINKLSNNVMSRHLLLSIAANYNASTAAESVPTPADTVQGASLIYGWMRSKGIQAQELVIENGSGLSRHERIAARSLGRMLVAAFQSPNMPELMSSMPLVGQDGTMRRRFNDAPLTGRAHIKTGRLDEVRAIAGYVLAQSGKRYAVVFLINHPNVGRAQEPQDLLLQWVYEQG